MPPKASSSFGALSERQMQLLCNYCRCMKSKPEIDMERRRSQRWWRTSPSARANINRLLAKILADQETSGDASPAKDAEDEDAGDAIAVAPASKKKAGGRKRKADTAETQDAEDKSPTKKKATPTNRKSKTDAKAASEEGDAPMKSEAGESADGDA